VAVCFSRNKVGFCKFLLFYQVRGNILLLVFIVLC
jgi:hypothetical protein